MPLKKDSIKAATYISIVYSAGFANGVDNAYDWKLEIYRSKNFSSFQAYYGAHLDMGKYKVAGYYRQGFFILPMVGKIPTGQYFFGNVGFNGGINFALPFRRWEWRPLGLEISIQKEFGDYLNFRKNLPDSVAHFIFRKSTIATLGLYTEFAGIKRRGTTYGFKIGYGLMLNPIRDFSNRDGTEFYPIMYGSVSSHVTKDRVTGYFQLNISGYGFNGQFGLTYRLIK